VIFDEYEVAETAPSLPAGPEAAEARVELEATRERLRAVVEQDETSQEEMRAANEELQSVNEELRSTLEELETDPPPNFHPAAIRVSAGDTPDGADVATGDLRSWSGLRSRSRVAVRLAAYCAGVA
jgi:hypothetical protein